MTPYFSSFRIKHGRWKPPLQGVLVFLAAMVVFCIRPVAAAPDESIDAVNESTHQQLHIVSDDSGAIDLATRSMEWNGNVKITLGPTLITADNVKVYSKENTGSGISLNADSIAKVIATGNVKIVTEDIVATAQEATYDAETKTLVLIGELAAISSDQLDMAAPKLTLRGFTVQSERP